MRLLRVTSQFAATPWAMELGRLQAATLVLQRAAAGEPADPVAIAEIEAAKADRAAATAAASKQSVAVIAVYGVISQRANMMMEMCGGTSTELLGQMLQMAVDDPSVRSIVLDIDSPGGSVFGVQEVADLIYQARERKPIAAIANATAASAAYWIGSAAHELFVTPSGEAGSIGVFAQHVDTTEADKAEGKVTTTISAGKYKTEGVGPLTDDAKAHMQARIDGYYTDFVKTVARNRGVAVDVVRNGYGQGRVLSAKAALEAGMVDGVATLPQVIQKYARRTTDTANARTKSHADAQIRIAAAALGPTP